MAQVGSTGQVFAYLFPSEPKAPFTNHGQFSLELYMSGTCKEWFDNIGYKSTLDKEQYTHLVWCSALASKVENFTSINKQSTPCSHKWRAISAIGEITCAKCGARK